MTYTKKGPFANGSSTPPVSAAFLDGIETELVNLGNVAGPFLLAPAPSGGDDSTALLAIINQAQATNGTVILRAGSYKANLVINDANAQPIIIGQGPFHTFIQSASNATPTVKFQGGSGIVSGGRLANVCLSPATGGGGVALTFSGCGGVKAENVRIDGNSGGDKFAEGVRWSNEQGADFTEFCTFEGTVNNVTQPFRYTQTNGVESFHGSGIVGNTVVGLLSTTTNSAVTIDAGCFPYNAPLSMTVFMNLDGQGLIYNGSVPGNRSPNFYGSIRIESQGMSTTTLGVGNNSVWLQGGVAVLAGNKVSMGNLWLVSKVHYDGSTTIPTLMPHSYIAKCSSTPVQLTSGPLTGGEQFLVSVHLRNSGYEYSYVLVARATLLSQGGNVTVLATTQSYQDGTHAYGAPSFTWNNGVYISNSNFPASTSGDPVTATVGVIPLGGIFSSDDLFQ